MRGKAVPLQIPTQGLVTNVPPHLAPPNALVDGYNVYIGINGLLMPRAGYSPVLSSGNVINARPHGGMAFQDQNGDVQYLVATDASWWALINGVWTSLAGTALSGQPADPARFAVYFQGGFAWAIGIDNNSPPQWWNSSLTTYAQLGENAASITSISETGTVATVTLAAATTNILVGDSVTIAGNSSSGFNGTWEVTGVNSTTSFTFNASSSGIATGTGGTATDNTLISAPVARDVTILANRVVMVNTVETDGRHIHRIRWSAAGDATRWPVLAYIDVLDAQDDPIVGIQPLGQNVAAIFGQQTIFLLRAVAGADASAFVTERLETAERFSGPASPASIVPAEGNTYYLSFDGRAYSFDGITVTPISAPVDSVFAQYFSTGTASECHGAYLASNRQIWFFFPSPTMTGVLNDPSAAMVLDLRLQAFLPIQTFSEGITASFDAVVSSAVAVTWQNCPSTWQNDPFTWGTSPAGFETDMIVCTASGEIDTFFRSATDGVNEHIVPWSATWTLFGDPQNTISLNRAEFYFVMVPGSTEIASAEFTTLDWPFDSDAPLASYGLSMADGYTTMPAAPGASNPANVQNNFIRLRLWSPQSQGGAAFGGGNLYLFSQPKGDYGGV